VFYNYFCNQKTGNSRYHKFLLVICKTMETHPFLEQRRTRLNKLCTEFKVSQLYAFGSVVSGSFQEDSSDIDLQVILMPFEDPVEKGMMLMELWDALETLFGRKVDLLTDQPITNPYFRERVERTKKLVYDRSSTKIPA